VLTGIGIYIVIEALGWEYLGPDGPGPGFFPLWYGLAIIVFSVLLVATSVVRRERVAAASINWGEVRWALLAWAGLAVSVGLLKLMGFMLAFVLFTFFLVYVVYRRPIGPAIVVSVCTAAGFYLIFPLALGVDLPTGFLGF
jgi:putative tricarboxylic transport membrane protein